MYTQCPECQSIFSLNAQVLAQARGRLLCGHCGTEFDGLATLAEQLPAEPLGELTLHMQSHAPAPVDLVVYRPEPPPPAAGTAIESNPPAAPIAAPASDFSQLVFTPRFARTSTAQKKPRSHRHLRQPGPHRGLWASACSVLLLLLAAQVAWAERDVLITQPASGAWLRASCATLHCTLPLVAAPGQLRIVDSNVQSHPGVAHALLISARVRNDAAFAQPYPVLAVTLSDAEGKRLAMRRLRPREYLADAATRRRGLGSGQSTVVMLEVADPGDQAVAFGLDLE